MSTTNTHQIPEAGWQTQFIMLSRRHQGWAVTIELLAGELGVQRAVDGLALQGISYEKAGSQAGSILVETGDAGTPYVTHVVHRPRTVWIAGTRLGDDVHLEIGSDEGISRIVRIFRRPELPEPPHARERSS